MSSLQITNISYPDPNGQIVVDFVDPPQSVNQIQVLPWTGYQWGSPISWNPGASGMSAGQIFIKVAGCTPGRSVHGSDHIVRCDRIGTAEVHLYLSLVHSVIDFAVNL